MGWSLDWFFLLSPCDPFFVCFLQAIATRDAMAKALYGTLFDWIVLQVNHALAVKQSNVKEVVCYCT